MRDVDKEGTYVALGGGERDVGYRSVDDDGFEVPVPDENGYYFGQSATNAQGLRPHELIRKQPFLVRNWDISVFIVLVVVGVALCFTVFRSELAPHAHTIVKLASIPLVSIVFTYMHIWLALHMTFYPLEFVGCYKPFIGWQGIVPMKAAKMASKAVDLMTTKLLAVEDVFARLDPKRVAQELGPYVHDMLSDIINEVAMQQAPGFWQSLPAHVRDEVIVKAAEDSPTIIADMTADVGANIRDVFDLKDMVINALVRDKQLLVDLFINCGKDELLYIKVLGGKIGFFFGMLQMTVWIYYKAGWVLPVTGFLVGYLTNWLALKMIFQPIEPYYVCGVRRFKIHGLFLQRQREVASVYAQMVTSKVITSRNITHAILRGPSSDKLFAIIAKHVKIGLDKFSPFPRNVIDMVIGSERYEQMKEVVCEHVLDHVEPSLSAIEDYADEMLDLEVTLREKLAALSSAEFEALLHPVFEEDEWKLIVLGGILGIIVGTLQTLSLGS